MESRILELEKKWNVTESKKSKNVPKLREDIKLQCQ